MRQTIRRRRVFKEIGIILLILLGIIAVAIGLLAATGEELSTQRLLAVFQGSGATGHIQPGRYCVPADQDACDGMLEDGQSTGVKKPYGTIAFRVNTTPSFPKAGAAGNLLFESSSDNIHLLQLEIRLEDGTSIYQSGYVYPGTHIPEAKLDEKLEAGTYAATAHIFAYDPQSVERVGETTQALTITIGS